MTTERPRAAIFFGNCQGVVRSAGRCSIICVASLVFSLHANATAAARPAVAADRATLVGRWIAEMKLPNGIKITDIQTFRPDGFATGRIIVYYRDGSIKSRMSYNLAWRIERGLLKSEDVVRVPAQPEMPDHSDDEILRLDADGMELRDLSNNIVVTYRRS